MEPSSQADDSIHNRDQPVDFYPQPLSPDPSQEPAPAWPAAIERPSSHIGPMTRNHIEHPGPLSRYQVPESMTPPPTSNGNGSKRPIEVEEASVSDFLPPPAKRLTPERPPYQTNRHGARSVTATATDSTNRPSAALASGRPAYGTDESESFTASVPHHLQAFRPIAGNETQAFNEYLREVAPMVYTVAPNDRQTSNDWPS